MNKDTRFLSPPEVGRILGVGADKVLSFIASGELRAINTSLSNRARWKIDPSDFNTFLASRANHKPSPQRPRRVSIPKPKKTYV
ncbi:MAG: helix-turn-helix domain-containing protein [Planctomycetes bacterium]|nr:helix-turn-helix domain-containing protein [Planctomycetota bacterium]